MIYRIGVLGIDLVGLKSSSWWAFRGAFVVELGIAERDLSKAWTSMMYLLVDDSVVRLVPT